MSEQFKADRRLLSSLVKLHRDWVGLIWVLSFGLTSQIVSELRNTQKILGYDLESLSFRSDQYSLVVFPHLSEGPV